MAIRVIISDDHAIFRRILRGFLDLETDIAVIAEAGDGQQLLELARSVVPDVICMDIRMPGMDGIEATQRLLADQPGARVIGLSSYNDPHYIDAMLRAGACGYLSKMDAADRLPDAIRAVAGGARFVLGPGIVSAAEPGAPGGV